MKELKGLTLTVPLNEVETLTISGSLAEFDITNQADSGSREVIGRFEKGKWVFDTPHQEKLFFSLFDSYRSRFHSAVDLFRSQVQ